MDKTVYDSQKDFVNRDNKINTQNNSNMVPPCYVQWHKCHRILNASDAFNATEGVLISKNINMFQRHYDLFE